jgi:hypothetical protein
MPNFPGTLTVDRVERWYQLLVRVGYDRIFERAAAQARPSGPPAPITYDAPERPGAPPKAEAEQASGTVVFDVAQLMRDIASGGLMRELASVVLGEEPSGEADMQAVAEAVGPFALACAGLLTMLMSLGSGSGSARPQAEA